VRIFGTPVAADPNFAKAVREQFFARRRAALATILNNAVKRGELTHDRATTILDLVFGSLWYRLIFATGPVDNTWADAITDTFTTPGVR
jgi:hypothetical protein